MTQRPTTRNRNLTSQSQCFVRGRRTPTCKIFTLKCMFGNPDVPLSSSTKSMKVGDIRNILEKRGLDTKGFKPVLLDRLQKDLPYVRIELDSRECIQRLVNAFLYFMEWDNTHLFAITMPRRGSLITNPRSIGPMRKLQGAAFGAFEGQPDGVFDNLDDVNESPPAGGCHSLEELSLQAGDKLDVLYDFGDANKFRIEIESVKADQEPLPEVHLGYLNPTRARLVNKGGRISSQYDNSEDDNSEDCDY